MKRLQLLASAIGLIALGLVLRLANVGLPLWIRHYGGGLLWSAMVFVLVAVLRPPRWRRGMCVVVASTIAVTIELSRLYHAPWFDQFRATLAGQLLVGRLFSPWNVLVYAIGILVAAIATAPLVRRD